MSLELGALIAMNLKQLRSERGLSLGELSKLTGISKAMLSEMEKGSSNPTIATLWKLASGLNIPYTRLLEETQAEGSLIRREDVLEQSEEREHYRAYYYLRASEGRNLEIVLGELDGSSEHQTLGHGPNSEEFIYLQEGQLILRTPSTAYELRPGDALIFDSSKTHTYVNPGTAVTSFICLNLYPR